MSPFEIYIFDFLKLLQMNKKSLDNIQTTSPCQLEINLKPYFIYKLFLFVLKKIIYINF